MDQKKQAVLEEASALIEMFKAGFLDGYSLFKKPKTKQDWITLNRFYKLAFMKRFERKINDHLKKNKR